MSRTQSRSRSDVLASARQRPGYTLLELLLVAGILVALAAISWPAIARMMASQALQNDADKVRRSLGSVRATAIDHGLVYQFRYEPGGRRYIIIPWDRPDANTGSTGTSGSAPAPAIPIRAEMFTLSEQCQFGSSPATASLVKPTSVTTTSTAKPVAAISRPIGQTERLPQMWADLIPGTTDVNWSEPIRVFPDGQADESEVTVQDRTGRSQVVAIRGLTGSVSIQPVNNSMVTGGGRRP